MTHFCPPFDQIEIDVLGADIPFYTTPTPHGSIGFHRRPSIPATATPIDLWYGLPAVQMWADPTQPWHSLHPKSSPPTFDDGSFLEGFGEPGQMGDGQSETSETGDDFSSAKGEDTDLEDWQGLIGVPGFLANVIFSLGFHG
jgi:hypothetical protein